MAPKIVNRFKQLMASVPSGTFYASNGQVVPFRDTPYIVRLETDTPSHQYGVFKNDVFVGTVTTDINNVALVSVKLDKGDNEIKLVDSFTQKSTSAFLSARQYATWLAGEAQVVESIDTGIEQVLEDSRLATASASLIEDVFGRTIQTNNSFGYDLETYRELLQELRTAYRHYGATLEGIERVVRAFLAINPLVYDRSFGPRWILGKDIINPKLPQNDFTYYTTDPLTNINSSGAGVSITGFDSLNGIGVGTLFVDGTVSPKRLSWIPPGSVTGWYNAQITGNGEYYLKAAGYFDPIISQPGPFNIVAGENDVLKLAFDGQQAIEITLTAGGAVTAATLAADINAALTASPLYGAFWGAVAGAYDLYLSGAPMLRLNSGIPTAQGASITIFNDPAADAAQTIFNLPAIRGGTSVGYAPGVTTIVLSAATDMSAWPDTASVDMPFKVLVGGTPFHPVGTSSGGIVGGAKEQVFVTAINKGTKTLTLASPGTVNAHNQDELVYLVGDSPFARVTTEAPRGVTVNVTDYTLLPVVFTGDLITIQGTGAPTNWLKTTNAGTPSVDLPAVSHKYFDLDIDTPFDVNQDGMITIPIPDEILNYKGFNATIAVWAKIDDPSRAATQTSIANLNMSFDGGATYDAVVPTISGVEINAPVRPLEYSRTAIVPPTATKALLRIKTTAVSNGNLTIHKVRIIAPSAGLFLGDGTIPRNESKIKHGHFMYAWSRDVLTVAETDAIGISSTTQANPGHIDKIAPDMAWLDKFDVSEFDGFGVSKDVKGYFTEFDWALGTANNMELIIRTPPRFTYIRPALVNMQTQTLDFPLSPAYVASLDYVSDQDMANAVMLEDGIPLTQDQWVFTGPSQVQILYTPSSTSTYTFTYNAKVDFTTAAIDLGVDYADYIWFADYYAFIRPGVVIYESQNTTGVQFDGSGVAQLPEHALADQTTAVLTEDTGLFKRSIPASQWNFIDTTSIGIQLDVFNPASLYEFTYIATANHTEDSASVTVEIRSATSVPGLAVAVYRPISPNDVVGNGYRYHQMRITLNGVEDLADIRVRSLLLKGLNMFGPGTIPVLKP